MITIHRTNTQNEAFINLVVHLDHELAQRDGGQHEFYNQFNSISDIRYAVMAYRNKEPVGCGALKEFNVDSIELKRMFVLPEARGYGVASKIIKFLERWARALGYKNCVLETGKRQPEAIALYTKNGYKVIPNYGQYKGVENSICFSKSL